MKNAKFINHILLALILIVSCRAPSTNTDRSNKLSPLEEFKAQAALIMPNIADPTDIAILFDLTLAEYNPELVNDPMIWKMYTGDPLFAAANLGVYMADAIYQYAYDQTEPAYLSWMAAKSLAEELGFIDIFEDIVIKRIEGDLTPKDSLFNSIDEAMGKMDSIFTIKDKLRIYTTLLSGNYIEKVHLVMGTLLNPDIDLPEETRLLLYRELVFVLIDQLQSLEQLIDLIEQHETIEDSGYFLLEFKKMRDIFYSFDLSADNLADLTYDQIFRNEKLKDLHQHVIHIRTFLISNGTRMQE